MFFGGVRVYTNNQGRNMIKNALILLEKNLSSAGGSAPDSLVLDG